MEWSKGSQRSAAARWLVLALLLAAAALEPWAAPPSDRAAAHPSESTPATSSTRTQAAATTYSAYSAVAVHSWSKRRCTLRMFGFCARWSTEYTTSVNIPGPGWSRGGVAYYACWPGHSLSGSTCWRPSGRTCPSGWLLSGSTCSKTDYSCPSGWLLSGSRCRRHRACPSGQRHTRRGCVTTTTTTRRPTTTTTTRRPPTTTRRPTTTTQRPTTTLPVDPSAPCRGNPRYHLTNRCRPPFGKPECENGWNYQNNSCRFC